MDFHTKIKIFAHKGNEFDTRIIRKTLSADKLKQHWANKTLYSEGYDFNRKELTFEIPLEGIDTATITVKGTYAEIFEHILDEHLRPASFTPFKTKVTIIYDPHDDWMGVEDDGSRVELRELQYLIPRATSFDPAYREVSFRNTTTRNKTILQFNYMSLEQLQGIFGFLA